MLPLPRLTDYGLDITTEAVDGARARSARAVCAAGLDEKRRASACFAHIAYLHLLPPPVRIAHDTAAAPACGGSASAWATWRRTRRRATDRAQEEDTTTGLAQTDA